jgi:hypothetical protein
MHTKILIRKTGKTNRWKHNIKTDLREIRHNDVDRIHLAQESRGKVALRCERDNEFFDSGPYKRLEIS